MVQGDLRSSDWRPGIWLANSSGGGTVRGPKGGGGVERCRWAVHGGVLVGYVARSISERTCEKYSGQLQLKGSVKLR